MRPCVFLAKACRRSDPFDPHRKSGGTPSPSARAEAGWLRPCVRHVATDDSQKDVYPFVFDDMKTQRQLSEEGRKVAREMGGAMKALGVRLGEVYTSQLNRARETGSLISGKGGNPVSELTDSGAGSASAMANPSGSNSKVGVAIRTLIIRCRRWEKQSIVTHKTNIAAAFGKNFSDVKEGEALVYKPDPPGFRSSWVV